MAAAGGNDEQSWRTLAFRQNVRGKIEEAIRQSPNPPYKSAVEMENHAFVKAATKDQYLSFVARLIIHVREIDPKKGQQGPNGPQMGMGGPPQQGGPPQDPMMALRTMTSQQQGMGGVGGVGGDGMMQQQQQPNGQQQGGLNPLAMQQPRPTMMQVNPMMMGGQQMAQNRAPGPPQGMMVLNQQAKMRPQLVQQQPPPNSMVPNQGAVPSPMGGSITNQMTPSPAAYAHSPSGGVVPSPVGVGGGGYMRGGQVGAPSPGSALNTPINSVASPAPHPGSHGPQHGPQQVPRSAEDQAYLEKLKQLSKYIDPLRRMIARIDKDEDRKKELSKMKSLLDILSDHNRRCSMDTLIKCEQVLERLDFKVRTADNLLGHVPSVSSMARVQNDNMWQPLLDAINANIKSPMFNHTLQRVFGPSITMLMGAAYYNSSPASPPLKRRCVPSSEESSEIPDVLQGEIAHLDQRFKVQLDPVQHAGSKTVNLICQLDDKTLPCVPPISVAVPENYPDNPPRCNANKEQYETTEFLKGVLDSLSLHLEKMPSQYSITSLLDTWEMCVRQACVKPDLTRE